MQKCLLILLSLFWGTLYPLFAENVSVDKALQIASNFTKRIAEQQLRSNQPLQLAYTAQSTLRSGAPDAYYYVFNSGKGFIIVSGDDRAYPILGYSTSGNFSYEEAPDNMKWWLQEYANQIQFAHSSGIEQDTEVKQQWQELQAGTGMRSLRSLVKLETALWEQHSPFNDQCPMVSGQRSVTGCVATAMAIIMKYHQYPQQGTGSYSYTDKYEHTYSASFATTYDWNSMLDDYTSGSYTPEQGQAVAKLMYHCGVSCDMAYDPSGSSAILGKAAIALPKYFGYDAGACAMVRDGHPADEWASIIQEELNNNRPVAYGGQSGNYGHAFVLAGYDNSNQYYVNWGWGKKYDGTDYNGWFPLSALTLDGTTYSYQQDMVLRIQKPAGGEPLYRIVIANSNPGVSKGMILGSTPLRPDNFMVEVSSLVVECSGPFSAVASIAHISSAGEIKSIVSGSHFRLNIDSPDQTYNEIKWPNCKITEQIESGDQLCMVYTIIDSGPYIIVNGTSELPTRINLTDGGSTTTFSVTWNTPTGVTVNPESGYNSQSIAEGGSFKFKITNSTGKNIVVQNGTTILTPDASGVYTLSDIQSDIQLTITLEAPPITFMVTLPIVTGFDIEAVSGYDPASVAEEDDFKFTVVPKTGYEQYTVKVTSNNVLLTPETGNIYTIRNIQANQVVKVEATAPTPEITYSIQWNGDDGVTLIPETGYNSNSIKEGDDFKFRITLDPEHEDQVLTVRVNGWIIYPDTQGVYTIVNITSNPIIDVTLARVFTVTYVKPEEDVEMVALNGYDPTKIVERSDFKFRLVSKYSLDNLTVMANDVTLYPSNSIYTIRNIREDVKITVVVNNTDVSIEKIIADQVKIDVRGRKLCITHPYMKNVPVYVTSFGGNLVKTDVLNGVYTELDLSVSGAYIVSFKDFSMKVLVR